MYLIRDFGRRNNKTENLSELNNFRHPCPHHLRSPITHKYITACLKGSVHGTQVKSYYNISTKLYHIHHPYLFFLSPLLLLLLRDIFFDEFSLPLSSSPDQYVLPHLNRNSNGTWNFSGESRCCQSDIQWKLFACRWKCRSLNKKTWIMCLIVDISGQKFAWFR